MGFLRENRVWGANVRGGREKYRGERKRVIGQRRREGGKAAGLLYLFLSCFEEDMREEQGRKNTEE